MEEFSYDPHARKHLLELLRKELDTEIDFEEFCADFEHTVNFKLDRLSINKHEMKVFQELFDIVVWYSSSSRDRSEYPKHFKDEVQILEAVNRARRELGLQVT